MPQSGLSPDCSIAFTGARAARRQSPDTVCAIDCYAPKLTNRCLTALGSMDHIPEQELCVTAIHQITAIGLHRARHHGTLIGFLQCSHGCQQGTEHPEQSKEAVLIHVKIAIPYGITFCADFVQPSKERLELVKILESLKIRRLNRGLWFPPATSFGIRVVGRRVVGRRVVGRRVVSPRSVVRLCTDCCIVIKTAASSLRRSSDCLACFATIAARNVTQADGSHQSSTCA